uniref:Carboxypeptidase n=1 Tax=Phaeomonas parva TaxID=124430 RepID=A0A7S1XNW1_9STRA|mmetsp:Transcript_20073/g.60817  ORF Transcript_20073/g.60817 Transcript_20073/m.60817 type:complete len:408 (+) Transcript_20073:176-1399(+)
MAAMAAMPRRRRRQRGQPLLLALAAGLGLAAARLHPPEVHQEPEEGDARRLIAPNLCADPVRKGRVEFPASLAGRATVDFNQWSGYVNVTSKDYLFYWLVEAAEEPEKKPLLLWTNGGPGCSAMEGATTENGPLSLYKIKESKDLATGQLSTNPYAWNRHANVLYLDQPRYVGNSFGSGPKVLSSVDAGADVVTFLRGFYELFPEYVGRPLLVAGESYGGHYVPAIGAALMAANKASAAAAAAAGKAAGGPEFPLEALVIGNGCVDDAIQDSTDNHVEFLKAAKLIPQDSHPRTLGQARAEVRNTLGYTPNYYDYRLKKQVCSGCYDYDYNMWSHWFLQPEVIKALNICGAAGYDAFAGAAGGCINLPGFDAHDSFDYSAALGQALDAGVRVLFYYGMTDTVTLVQT